LKINRCKLATLEHNADNHIIKYIIKYLRILMENE